MNKPSVTTGIILEIKNGLPDSKTGGTQSLTKAYTLEGNMVSIWSSKKPAFKENDEVAIVTETETRENQYGEPTDYHTSYLLPPAFAAKIAEQNESAE